MDRPHLKPIMACVTILVVALFIPVHDGVAGGAVCGNGVLEYPEECDDAAANSDVATDSCRSNCVLHFCGDSIVDSDEECDSGRSCNHSQICNNNLIPNFCRQDCRRAHCGDGVRDAGEECDDGNADAYDGCHECRHCYLPQNDLVLSADMGNSIRLCPGTYPLRDSGSEGVIIIIGNGMDINCVGMILESSATMPADRQQTAVSTGKAARLLKTVSSGDSEAKTEGPGLSGRTVRQRDRKRTVLQNEPAAVDPATNVPNGPVATVKYGTGIVVTGKDVVLHNCTVKDFKTGIKLHNNGTVLFNNRACNNGVDVDNGSPSNLNYGVKNACGTLRNWQDNSAAGCLFACGQ